MAHSVPLFVLTLVPLAFGIGFGHPTMSSLVSLVADGDEQGRVQGAASAVESLGRTIGPVWGNASLAAVRRGGALRVGRDAASADAGAGRRLSGHAGAAERSETAADL